MHTYLFIHIYALSPGKCKYVLRAEQWILINCCCSFCENKHLGNQQKISKADISELVRSRCSPYNFFIKTKTADEVQDLSFSQGEFCFFLTCL